MFTMFFTCFISCILISVAFSSAPPKIMPSQTLPTSEGSNFKIFCGVISGTEPFVFKWNRFGQTVTTNSNYRVDNLGMISTLNIIDIKAENAGNYTCRVSNQFGEDSLSYNVIVKAPLIWSVEPKDTSASLNDDLLIKCEANGYPRPKISWIKENLNDQIISHQGVLKIIKLTKEKSGYYECIADNGVDAPLRKRILIRAFGKH